MRLGVLARLVSTIAAVSVGSETALAQVGSGDGFLFKIPRASLTLFGGFAQPSGRSDLFDFTTRELTVGRSDFLSGNYGADLSFALAPNYDLVLGIARSRSSVRSEFRDWVDNNSLPIEQSTYFGRTPMTAAVRYHFAPRGRQVGSYAWIPTRFVPFVGIGGGVMKYQFEQAGDFIDFETLNVFDDHFTTTGWAPVLQGSAGAAWSLNQRWLFTGEVRYLRGRGNRNSSTDDFQGFQRLDLSGVTTHVGLTLRF